MIEPLPSMCEFLGLIPSTKKIYGTAYQYMCHKGRNRDMIV